MASAKEMRAREILAKDPTVTAESLSLRLCVSISTVYMWFSGSGVKPASAKLLTRAESVRAREIAAEAGNLGETPKLRQQRWAYRRRKG